VFINGGSRCVASPQLFAHWQRFYSRPACAPFIVDSPTFIELQRKIEDGSATPEGPVSDPDGTSSSPANASTWRLDAGRGSGRSCFDNGTEVCRCAKSAASNVNVLSSGEAPDRPPHSTPDSRPDRITFKPMSSPSDARSHAPQQHRVAVAEEAVARRDRVPVHSAITRAWPSPRTR
jgi:hypothetical protein